MTKKRGRELFMREGEGRVSDAALHEEILDNDEADARIAEMAIQRGLRMGLTRSQAERTFGKQPKG